MGRPTKIGSTFRHNFSIPGTGSFKTACLDQKFVTTIGPEGTQQTPVSCNKCKHCMWVRRNSMASSVQMELNNSDWAVWLTLTIAPGPDRAVDHYDTKLEPKLLTKFHDLCRIHKRRKNYSFEGRNCTGWRYVQCGEFGKNNTKRAHYHVVIFGKGDKPHWADQSQKFAHIAEWPWGHVDIDIKVNHGVAFYLSCYMRKDGKKSWYSQSNRWAIGAEFVKSLGDRLAREGFPHPTVDWKKKMGRYHALIRGSKRRDLVVAFCKTAGVSQLSLLKTMPPTMISSIVGIERDVRAKARGIKSDQVFAWERLKREVWAEARAVLGIAQPADLRHDRPQRPPGWSPDYGKHGSMAHAEAA